MERFADVVVVVVASVHVGCGTGIVEALKVKGLLPSWVVDVGGVSGGCPPRRPAASPRRSAGGMSERHSAAYGGNWSIRKPRYKVKGKSKQRKALTTRTRTATAAAAERERGQRWQQR